MIGASSNEFEDVHKMQFLYPYNALATLDTSSSLLIWTWENINAFKFLLPAFRINLATTRGRALNCNQMFFLRLRNSDLISIVQDHDISYLNSIKQQIDQNSKETKKAYVLYLTDEKGCVFGVNINHILKPKDEILVKGKNQMKRNNYYPFRT